MTVVGKILVFLNLLFSLAVGGFAVANYAARTRYAKAFEELESANRVVTESRNLYKAESDQRAAALHKTQESIASEAVALVPDLRARDAGGKELKDAKGDYVVDPAKVAELGTIVRRAMQGLREQNKMLETETDRLRAAVVDARNARAKAEIEARSAVANSGIRQKDVEDMRRLLREETKTNTNLIKENNDLRDKMVQSTIDRQTAQDRAGELTKQVEELGRQLERMKSSGGAGAGAIARGTNPPPENVEGLVKRTDASGLVTITIGSDAGIARGHTLEVFRLKPLPKYLGQIRIVSVTHKEAVGQASGRLTGQLQVGDVVASRIQGR